MCEQAIGAQLTLFSGPSSSRRRGQSEGGELTGGGETGSRIMVDELEPRPRARHRCFRPSSCHLTTDGDLEQLHDFARRLGLKRAWYQDHPLHPHYDLTASKRTAALRLGAVFVPAREQARVRLGIARREK